MKIVLGILIVIATIVVAGLLTVAAVFGIRRGRRSTGHPVLSASACGRFSPFWSRRSGTLSSPQES